MKRMWTKTAGLLFLAASAVYNGRAIAGGMAKAASPLAGASDTGTEVVSLPDPAPAPAAVAKKDAPVAAAPTTAPAATQPSATAAAAPAASDAAPAATQPSTGRSVSASEVAVSKDAGTVEIHVNDANLVEVLRMLSLQANTNILPSKEVRGTVTANLYDVTIKEALDAILQANGYGYREKGNVIYVYSAKEIAEMEKSERKMNTEVFHLYYTPAINAQTMIKPVLSSEAQVSATAPAIVGIASDKATTGGNNHAVEDMLVVTDYPENLDRVRRILKDVDKRPQQIMVEATILTAQLSEDNSLGVDFSLLGGVDFKNLTGGAVPSGQTAANGTLTQQTTGTTGGTGSTGTSSNPNVVGYTAANTGFTQGLPTGGLRVGFVYNNVAAFIQALEEVTNTTVLANPKVLVLNKQKGEVKVARQDPYRGKTTVNENGLSQQEVDFLETGTLLIFRPYIADDGYIRMEVHPEDSTPLPSRAADLPPTKLTTETTTNIMVKDGHTVVIGGMFRETNQTSKQQVPGLGNVPLLGRLFGNQQDSTQREEVIILLTPHIIKDEALFDQMSKEQQKEMERLRVGVRKGMMPWGRERLADCYYENAVKEWNKPNPDRHKVLWNLDCAINLNPTFAEALDLKVKVTGREVTASDNSTIRYFVRDMILNDRGAVTGAAAPATQPSGQASATTQPSGQPSMSISPTTRPSGTVMAAPATQPSVAAAPATQPASVASVDDGSDDVDDEDFDDGVASTPVATPATQPAVAASPADKAPSVTVSELPVEEVKDLPEKSEK